MVDVVTSIEIDKPVDVVAAFASDPANAPAWYVNIDSVEWESEPGVAVGAKATFVARFLGRTLRYTYELVDMEPGERLVMRTADGPFPMETTYTWGSRGADATVMTLRNRGEPRGFGVLVSPFVGRAMARANRKDLRTLKALLEG